MILQRGRMFLGAYWFTLFIAFSCGKFANGQNSCGATFTAPQGLIESPMYPGIYPNNLDCTYIIRQPAQFRIILTIIDMQIEENYNYNRCIYDYVEFLDGGTETSPLMNTRRYCGNATVSALATTGNEMMIHFITDTSIGGRGFAATYKAVIMPDDIILMTQIDAIIRAVPEPLTFQLINISSVVVPAGIDYDPRGNRLYWTDQSTSGIHSSFLNGSDDRIIRDLGLCGHQFSFSPIKRNSVVPSGTISIDGMHSFADEHPRHQYNVKGASPEGLAVDRSGLVFYTDAGCDVIGVLSMSGANHKYLIDTNLDMPRGIALHTGIGIVFWTDWGFTAKIESCNYDGTDRKYLVITDLGFPNALAVDERNNLLYWVDAWSDKIERSDLNGRQRTEIFRNFGSHYFGCALANDHLYFTDRQSNWLYGFKSSLRRINTDGSNITDLLYSREVLDDVHYYTANTDTQALNGCGLNNGNCSHFCFPLPNNNSKCDCPDLQVWNPVQRTCNQGPDPCSVDNGGCSDTCLPLTGSGRKCVCPKGKFLLSDQQSCSSECGGIYNQLTNIITTPLYPNNYPNNIDCVYIVQLPESRRVLCSFTDFNMDSAQRCLFDYMEVRDGRFSTSPQIGNRYCGSNLPGFLVSSGNAIWIRIKTDAILSFRGFNVTCSAI